MSFGRKAFALVALAFLIPACGDDNDGPAVASSGSVLFEEDFATVFPGTRWTPAFTTGSGASMIVDGAEGNAAPSLAMTTTGDPAFISTNVVMTFASRPLTVSVQMSADDDHEGSGGIAILDSLGNSIAAAEWHPATPGAVTLRILSTTLGISPPAPKSGFHTFTFSVTSTGEASWRIDNAAVPAMTESGFPSDTVSVQLYDNIPSTPSSEYATFRFDNLTVSSP